MSPQHSNRDALLEAALLCLQKLPAGEVTARAITEAAGANLASIGYHFGSTNGLLSEALAVGFRRWLSDLGSEIETAATRPAEERLEALARVVVESAKGRETFLRAFLAAVAAAPFDDTVRQALAESYAESRETIAGLLELGQDQNALNAATLLIAVFDGLIIQGVVDPATTVEPDAMSAALARLLAITS